MLSGSGLGALGLLLIAVSAAPVRLTVDSHLHVTMDRAAVPVFKGEPGKGAFTWSPRATLTNQIDADQLIASGGQLALAAMWIPYRIRPGRRSLDEALNQLAALRQFCMEQPRFVMVKNAAEARAQIAKGRIALIPAIEGGEGIDNAADMDRLYAAGVRSVTLVHFTDTHIGGAAHAQMAYNALDSYGKGVNPIGLSEQGAAVMKHMLELGIIVDLAHASDATSEAALTIAEERGVPVINSHSGSRALLDMERNVPDALAVRIARGGGMLGVTLFDHMVAHVPDSAKWEGYVAGSCDDIVAHWKHLASVIPPEQLNLGSDFNGMIRRPQPGGSCPVGIRNTNDLPDFYEALVKHGVPRAAIDGMGWRFLQMWEAIEKKADVQAIEAAESADSRAASPFDVAL